MSDKKLLDHDYDGIQELDNPLPSWWLLTFYATIAFSVVYFIYYQFMGGPTLNQEYEKAVAERALTLPPPSADGGSSAEALAKAINDSVAIQTGKTIFEQKCLACHAAGGAGSIGPNLTDRYWITGDGSPSKILAVIKDGVAAKGMPPWGTVLKEEESISVAAYVVSLKGSSPANPKAPQGNEIK